MKFSSIWKVRLRIKRVRLLYWATMVRNSVSGRGLASIAGKRDGWMDFSQNWKLTMIGYIPFRLANMLISFPLKDPEINRMHKKMLRVHQKVYQARAISKRDCGMQELWKAQCNCPYWHGVFGGVYL